MGTDMTRWADRAQYVSEAATDIRPVVTLLNATPDPLGGLAALVEMYKGRVVRSLGDVTDDMRRLAFADMMKTELSGALESIQFHFLIENVTRAHTHQEVRTRQAFYAQESMRFAVVEDWADRVAMPPTLAAYHDKAVADQVWHDYHHHGEDGYPRNDASRREWRNSASDADVAYVLWRESIEHTAKHYNELVNRGMPAEDARGLMPHAITTRLHAVLSLRTLLHEAGLRLCTQAQFEWRSVMAGMVNVIRAYGEGVHSEFRDDSWQFQTIADALKPVCYQKGKCTMMASMDRGCSIRERVDANAQIGRPSSEWSEEADLGSAREVRLGMPLFPWVANTKRGPRNVIPGISPAEWALDPGASRHDGGGFVGEG